MKRIPVLPLLLLLLPFAAAAQRPQQASGEWPEHTFGIPEVTVVGRRPIREIGVQQTRFDSTVLKENIALSMADVLNFHSSIFVKSYGRATLSTVAFRGTSPSHTQVTWNGMRINSPMLGMTDFSMIPAYFIDDASLLHGTSSVNLTGGGLGGAVQLATRPAGYDGAGVQFVQGIGSFGTLDDFLRLGWGNDRWQVSLRAVYASSDNDFPYRNRDKKLNVYDDQHHIIAQYSPVERNRNGAFRDLHLLQEIYFNTGRGDRFGLNGWYVHSNRELALLTTDYAEAGDFENRQREESFRGVLSWEHLRSQWKTGIRAGFTHTWSAYDYARDAGNGTLSPMTRSRSRVNTLFATAEGEYTIGRRWLFTAEVSAYQQLVESADRNIIRQDGTAAVVGYDQGRLELSGSLSAKWRPTERIGLGAVLREECFGNRWAPIIPALFLDGVLSRRGSVVAKASISRNYRFPTLNDLYFLPGGNPDLRPERGWSYDAGASFRVEREGKWRLTGSATWFDSRIDDWILWLPTVKGFFSPRNMKRVHAYGVEVQAGLRIALGRGWQTEWNGSFSWTPSRNEGEPLSEGDRSVGKQLPYVPERSASLTARLSWRTWSLLYKWNCYSRRYTMTNEAATLTGSLPAYYMNNLSLEKRIGLRWADLSLRGAVNNLFDEEYLSVLSRPMPGIHFEFFLGITPKFKPRHRQP